MTAAVVYAANLAANQVANQPAAACGNTQPTARQGPMSALAAVLAAADDADIYMDECADSSDAAVPERRAARPAKRALPAPRAQPVPPAQRYGLVNGVWTVLAGGPSRGGVGAIRLTADDISEQASPQKRPRASPRFRPLV